MKGGVELALEGSLLRVRGGLRGLTSGCFSADEFLWCSESSKTLGGYTGTKSIRRYVERPTTVAGWVARSVIGAFEDWIVLGCQVRVVADPRFFRIRMAMRVVARFNWVAGISRCNNWSRTSAIGMSVRGGSGHRHVKEYSMGFRLPIERSFGFYVHNSNVWMQTPWSSWSKKCVFQPRWIQVRFRRVGIYL